MEQVSPKPSRRGFFRIASSAAAAGYVTGQVIEAVSPQERLDKAIAELKAAAEAVWPDIDDWNIKIGIGRSLPIVIAAFTPIGKSMSEPMYPPKPGAKI